MIPNVMGLDFSFMFDPTFTTDGVELYLRVSCEPPVAVCLLCKHPMTRPPPASLTRGLMHAGWRGATELCAEHARRGSSTLAAGRDFLGCNQRDSFRFLMRLCWLAVMLLQADHSQSVQAMVSNYMANSAFYVLYKSKMLSGVVTPSMLPPSVPLKLNTTFFKSFLPALYNAFPNRAFDLVVSAP